MRRSRLAATATLVLLAGCQQAAPAAHSATPTPSATPAAASTPNAQPTPVPTPPLPAYYIESLRARPHMQSTLSTGAVMFRGAGFTKYEMSWQSGGQVMTGTISLPDGPGPFPVVVVNHGFIPPSRYWVGQDSGIFGDPMAAHGFVSVAPDYPDHAGSGPGDKSVDSMSATVMTVMDLISALATVPQVDLNRIGVMGHSNGGGVSLMLMVTDPRVKVAALFAPVSSLTADNARKWWLASGAQGPMGTPEQNPEGYMHASPRNYFSASTPPAIFLQGTLDEDIPAEWTTGTRDALAAKSVKTDLVWFPGAHHDLVGADLQRADQLAEAWVRSGLGL
jgi:dipeptidyl aminopeptidase/acylaminoacyl peptidase